MTYRFCEAVRAETLSCSNLYYASFCFLASKGNSYKHLIGGLACTEPDEIVRVVSLGCAPQFDDGGAEQGTGSENSRDDMPRIKKIRSNRTVLFSYDLVQKAY